MSELEQPLPGSNEQDAGRSRRILIVEDEPNNRVLLQKIVSNMGYESEWVGDGNDAVAAAANRHLALILMDMSLPGLSGSEATQAIRDAGSTVPIVATSAHAMAEDKKKAMDAGCNEYVVKPFNLPDLRRIIKQLAPLPEQQPS